MFTRGPSLHPAEVRFRARGCVFPRVLPRLSLGGDRTDFLVRKARLVVESQYFFFLLPAPGSLMTGRKFCVLMAAVELLLNELKALFTTVRFGMTRGADWRFRISLILSRHSGLTNAGRVTDSRRSQSESLSLSDSCTTAAITSPFCARGRTSRPHSHLPEFFKAECDAIRGRCRAQRGPCVPCIVRDLPVEPERLGADHPAAHARDVAHVEATVEQALRPTLAQGVA